MEHQSATLDAAEVATLYGVDKASLVDDGLFALPVGFVLIVNQYINIIQDDVTPYIVSVISGTFVLGSIERLLARCQGVKLRITVHTARE